MLIWPFLFEMTLPLIAIAWVISERDDLQNTRLV